LISTGPQTTTTTGRLLATIGGALVGWQSKKQGSVALSSTEAEFIALSFGAEEIKFINMLITELTAAAVMPSILHEDNGGAIFLANNVQIGQRTKHIVIRYRLVNEMVNAYVK
jgi:hypothetical protein